MGIVVDPEIRSLFGEQKFDRRAFVVTSLGAGFALAVLPVSAQTITTPADGLVAGEVKVPAKGGDMPAYRAMPATGSNFPTVLVVSEIWGVHEHIKDVTRRLAKLGYYAIAPELFARQGDAGKVTDTQALIRDIVAKTPDAEVMADLDATVAYAKASGKADTAKLGITGFCWGGRTTLMYAAHNANVKAAVPWYGPVARSVLPGRQDRARPGGPDQGAGARPLRRRGSRHPERHGREDGRGAQGRRQHAFGIRHLSRHAARIPRGLPAELPQGQGRGRLEARDGVVQAAPGLNGDSARAGRTRGGRGSIRPPLAVSATSTAATGRACRTRRWDACR